MKKGKSLLDTMAPVYRFKFDDGHQDISMLKARLSEVTQLVTLATSEDPESRSVAKAALEKLMRQYLEAELRQYVEAVRQSEKGKKGASKRWGNPESREFYLQLIATLAMSQDQMGPISPADLWPLFFSELDNAGMGPKETNDGKHMAWEDNPDGISFKTFSNRISVVRGELLKK